MSGLRKWVLIIAIILGFIAFNYWGPRMIVKIRNPIFSFLDDFDIDKPNPNIFTKLQITSKDSLSLNAIYRKTKEAEKGTIILVHGIRAYKETFIPISSYLDSLGYNSLLIDLRAHGSSGGSYCTFGYKEKEDISLWIDELVNIKSSTTNIGIWGQSLGGAISLQAMAHDKRIKFGIIESTYSNFRTIVSDYFSQNSGFKAKPITDYLLWRADYLAHMKSDSVNPLDVCKKITQAIFIAHGTVDNKIKMEYNKSNFNAIPSKDKTWYPVKDAGHLNLWNTGGEEYFDAVEEFLGSLK